jgi:hypothetical protein
MENNITPFYRGHEGFQEVLADKQLNRPGRAIRVYNYAGPAKNEKLYVIGTVGQLFDSATGNKVEPKNVFSMEAAPDGWSVEGLDLLLLSEEELIKVLNDL